MLIYFVKIYLYLIITNVSSKNSFQHNQSSDDFCLYVPDLSLKYFMHNQNDNKNIEDRKKIDSIKELCGGLCQTYDPKMQNGNTKIQHETKENYYKLFEPPSKHVRCDILWSDQMVESQNSPCVPPRIISDDLQREFSYNYTIKLEYSYHDDSPRMVNDREEIQKLWRWHGRHGIKSQIALLDKQLLVGGYGIDVTRRLQRLIRRWINVKDGHILVIGSVNPWIEVILLSEGANNITTLDYFPYSSDVSKINTITHTEISMHITNGNTPTFDAVISFSSLEHSGLGRYGDEINPWADIITMARSWCVLKPGGRALVGVPTAKDKICFNGNKFYGPLFYNQVFTNWNQLHTEIDPEKLTYEAECLSFKDRIYQPVTIWERR